MGICIDYSHKWACFVSHSVSESCFKIQINLYCGRSAKGGKIIFLYQNFFSFMIYARWSLAKDEWILFNIQSHSEDTFVQGESINPHVTLRRIVDMSNTQIYVYILYMSNFMYIQLWRSKRSLPPQRHNFFFKKKTLIFLVIWFFYIYLNCLNENFNS